jgi:quinolinate synthase
LLAIVWLWRKSSRNTSRHDCVCWCSFYGRNCKDFKSFKKVVLPDLKAGCSLADSCPPSDFEEFVKKHPNHVVVSYVNTSAEIKALTDIVCTSSNAEK